MILVIDNYDSFVFNIARYVEELGRPVRVLRCDRISAGEIGRAAPAALILSPGPGTPEGAGVSLPAVKALSGRIPILGICLGHQCIGAAFGGEVGRARTPMHGRISRIAHRGSGLFRGLPRPLAVGRYHSLIVRPGPEMAAHLDVDALSEDGEIMALSHRTHPTFGVQFHPESILTEAGHALLANFLDLAGA